MKIAMYQQREEAPAMPVAILIQHGRAAAAHTALPGAIAPMPLRAAGGGGEQPSGVAGMK